MKSSFDYSNFFQRNDKIMTNSVIKPFLSYSPSQRTNIYNIIHINYRWDGELMLERGLRPLSNYFPFPSGSAEAQKTACRWGRVRVRVTVNHYRQEEIRCWIMRKTHTDDLIHWLGHFYLSLTRKLPLLLGCLKQSWRKFTGKHRLAYTYTNNSPIV